MSSLGLPLLSPFSWPMKIPGGYSITFNTGRSMPIFRVPNFTLNQYLGSVNYNMDKNSIFWVHKSEKRKNRGVWCESPRH